MTVDVDDLFRGGTAPPAADPTPRIARIARVAGVGHTIGLLAGAVALAVSLAAGEGAPPELGAVLLGALVVYLLVVPSVVLTLYAWHRAGEELDRVRAGGLPRAYGARLLALRRTLLGWLVLASVAMAFQVWLLLPLLARGGPS